MPGFIGEDQVRRIKEAVDLVQLLGDYTTLKRAGNHHTGCCPFHQERSPSMHVYDDGHYHCFGCGAHGDVFTVIREKEHLDFSDAVEVLARRAGIEITYEAGRGGGNRLARSERDQLTDAMELATRFYEHVLWETAGGKPARDYLASRGLSEAVIRKFRLGWAPGSGALVDEARRTRIDATLLAKLDLAIDRNGRWGDRFFERVTFPICDRFGHPIAFSCRLLPEAERRAKEEGRGVGKYVNSTDTPLYHKGDVIFNLHHARAPAKEKGRLIVMEGPTDVMAAADAGFSECVAVLGTALTPEHAKQLGTISGNGGKLVLLFDGDRAGQTNSLKAIRTCLMGGVPSWVAVVPNEMDPAELLKEDADGGGVAAFEQVLTNARADVDHLLRTLAPRPYELEHRDLLAVADQVLDCLRNLRDRELIDLYLRDLARYLNLDIQRLGKRLAGGAGGPVAAADATATPAAPDLPAELDAVLHILVRRPELRPLAFDHLGLEPSHLPAAYRPILERLLLEPDCHADSLLLMGEEPELLPLKPALFRWVTRDLAERGTGGIPPGQEEQELRTSFERAIISPLEDEIHRIALQITEAIRDKNLRESMRLGAEQLALIKRLKDLRGR